MDRLLQQAVPLVRLTRVTTAFGVVGNVWFVILWSRAIEGEAIRAASPNAPILTLPLPLLLLASAVSSVALFAYGAALNDVLDLKRDRTLSPDRPLPSGGVSVDASVGVVTVALLTAILGSSVFGTGGVILTCLVAAALLLFNGAGRFVPGFGLLLLGLIYAGHMLVPNVGLRFLWPTWLVMTHALAVACAAHTLGRKVPRLTRRGWLVGIVGWILWSGVLLWIGTSRIEQGAMGWPPNVPLSAALWIGALAVLFVLVAWRKTRLLGPGPRAADKVWRYGSLWLTLYAAAWLFAVGHVSAGLVLLALAGVGFIGMTVLREAYSLVDQPLGFRR